MDEIVAFNQLSEENFYGIAEIMLGELRDALTERGVSLTWDRDVVERLVKDSFSVKYGARNLRRTIQKQIEDRVAEEIIASYMAPIHAIHVCMEGESIKIVPRE